MPVKPWWALGALLAIALLSCGDSEPTGLDTSDLQILIVRGDGQFGAPGASLPVPFEVRVESNASGRGKEGVPVRWEILEGGGGVLDPRRSVSDSAGFAVTEFTLGPELGTYRVKGVVDGKGGKPVEFVARAVLPPELSIVPADPVRAGDTILIGGRNFSPDPLQTVVTFSRIRGRVVSASVEELRVEVPACLPRRSVSVQVHLGAMVSAKASLEVLEGAEVLSFLHGQDRILDVSDGLSCFRLPSSPETEYLLVPHSTGRVGGGRYEISLVGLAEGSFVSSSQSPSQGLIPGLDAGVELSREFTSQQKWDGHVRALERILLKERSGLPVGVSPGRDPAFQAEPVPQMGDLREFKVLNRENKFDRVSALVRHISEKSIIYVDEDAPAGGFVSADLDTLAGQFEDPIHPTVTRVFGEESDLDQNGRVIILLTPAVNRLTESYSEGYIGGFFYGLDLLEGQDGSNNGEIFYALVPDPNGSEGPQMSRQTVLEPVPAILALEFEHMVHFHQRMLLTVASGQEALWLSEGLAQMAEDLVGEAFEAVGNSSRATEYQVGNWNRARRFLQNPANLSLIGTLPPGDLAERGAWWLFLRYLLGQEGNEVFLGRLTRSSLTGVDNVTQATGRIWKDLVSDWSGTLYLDGLGVPVRQGLIVPGLNLRSVLSRPGVGYPLKPQTLSGTFSIEGSLWSSSPDYYIITPPESGGLALNLAGPEGRPQDPAAGLRLMVVRIK